MKLLLPHKIAIGSGVTCLFILIFGWIAFPKIIKGQIRSMLALKPGSEIRGMYEKVPFPLVFKVYMFNVTNPVEITERGAQPILQEVGPFVYDEWKEKINVVDNEADDTLEYHFKNTFVFNPKLSAPLTGDEVVTIINPMIAGMALAVEVMKPGALSLLNKALISIHRNPATPFFQVPVNALLFTGVDIACNVTDFAGKAVCAQLKAEAPDLIEVEPDILRFSLFGPKNGTAAQRLKVLRGIKNIKDIGQVLEVDGKDKLDIWGTPECNEYGGTDTTIFAPFLKESEGLVSFGADICRRFSAYFEENTKYDGIPVRRYAADFGDQSTIPEEKCYCPSEDFCYKKGIHDLTKCVGAPMVASLPHFYLSDESYQRGVKGLKPNKDDHEIIILFEAFTGSPVYAKKRMQFAMPIHAIPKIAVMKSMPDVLLPLFWVEEGVALNSTWTGPLKTLFTTLKVVKVAKWLILVASLIGMLVAMFFLQKKTTVTITPVHDVKPSENKSNNTNVISLVGQNVQNGTNGHVNRAMSNEIDKY